MTRREMQQGNERYPLKNRSTISRCSITASFTDGFLNYRKIKFSLSAKIEPRSFALG